MYPKTPKSLILRHYKKILCIKSSWFRSQSRSTYPNIITYLWVWVRIWISLAWSGSGSWVRVCVWEAAWVFHFSKIFRGLYALVCIVFFVLVFMNKNLLNFSSSSTKFFWKYWIYIPMLTINDDKNRWNLVKISI